jgi:hypothetical protein
VDGAGSRFWQPAIAEPATMSRASKAVESSFMERSPSRWAVLQQAARLRRTQPIRARRLPQSSAVTARHPQLAGLVVLLLIFALQLWAFVATLPGRRPVVVAAPAAAPARARFGEHRPSAEARQIADRALVTHDAQDRPFMLIDKKAATLYVFDAGGTAIGVSPVLLGLARGDDRLPGLGQRPVAQMRPFERTTPAGRFVTAPGSTAGGQPVLWIDHGAALSMHRVRAHVAAERGLQRLASRGAADNRISFGGIDVPAAFFDSVVWPLFSQARGIAYVLPDTKPLHEVFAGLLAPVAATPPRSAQLDLGS